MSNKMVIAGAVGVAALLGITTVVTLGAPTAEAAEIVVYKSATCECCAKWVDHLRANGFTVTAHDVADLQSVKAQYGVSAALTSCHTAVVDGYVVEGHVPADVVQRLLSERPPVAGLAVPGMPMGSPGMEGPRSDPYEVVAFTADGSTSVYARR